MKGKDTRDYPYGGYPPAAAFIDLESILMREENRGTRRKTLGVRLRSTEAQPTYDPRSGLNPGHRKFRVCKHKISSL